MSDVAQPIYLDLTDPHSDFSRALQQRLRANGVQAVTDMAQAHAILHVTKDNTGHRVLSVSTRNTPQEYEVFYEVDVTLTARSGNVQSGAPLLQQPFTASRSITYDETAALAKQREELIISETLARDLADQLLRQIRRL